MKNIKDEILEDLMKEILPTVNREYYELVGYEKVKNEWKYTNIYDTRMKITIQEKTEIPKWLDKNLRYVHGYVTTTYEDRPSRSNAVTIISKRKRRKHKETWKILKSEHFGVQCLEGPKKPEDILFFLK